MSQPQKTWSLLLAAMLLPRVALGLVVHEWGTFTTVYSSDGVPLSGLYTDATRLPDFVHGLPYFNYGEAGWPSPEKLRNVTVKMETPVLYFYNKEALDVEVKVKFKGGTISQWYPERDGGEANPTSPYVDFQDQPYQGSIAWKARVLAAGTVLPYTTPVEKETGEWRAPRNTAANLVQGPKGEIEKFLFYRGIGSFTSALTLRFDGPDHIVIKNTGSEPISYAQIYDRPGPQGAGANAKIWWQGPLAAGQKVVAERPAALDYGAGSAAMDSLRNSMVKAGLNLDEARALLDTWYNGYFIESGLKAFWIVPRKQTDALLPLEIKPAPESLERVIIGRSEVLDPAFEAGLKKTGLDAYKNDRYYMAYTQLLKDWDYYHPQASGTAPGLLGKAGGNARATLGAPAWWSSPLFLGAQGAHDARGRAVTPLR